MTRRICVAVGLLLGLVGCDSGQLAIPRLDLANAGSSAVSPQFGRAGAVPQGLQVVFIGDVLTIRGEFLTPTLKLFFGMNNDLARRPESIFTLPRHRLPGTPFVYTDPVTGDKTILEVEVPIEVTSSTEIRITVPAACACSPHFTNPIVRMFGDAGSSDPVADVFWIVGPRCVAIAPKQGLDIGGETVTIHGEFLSPFTQVGVRYRDPVTEELRVIGDTLATDITEIYINRNTLVVPMWPGIVPNSTLGLARPLAVDILLFESVDEIAASIVAEPELDGDPPCNALRPQGPEVPLFPQGVRNSEVLGKFTYLPTGVTDYPSIAGLLPESGPEVGGNTVIIHGDQFDAFSADLSNPANPGIGIECPPGSGRFIAAEQAILVDRQTLVIKMPSCPVDIPEKVAFCIRNKFSIDNPGGPPAAGPDGSCVIFPEVYTYLPIPPIVPPVVTAILPATEDGLGCVNDFGLQRIMIVGDWFDPATELNGGVEFILPEVEGLPDPTPEGGNPRIVQAQRVILHNRNLIEVFTKRLPDPYYPLTSDILATLRVRNTVGHADFEDLVLFKATGDAEAAPVLAEVCGTSGPTAGGFPVLVFGENFDTSTEVLFGSTAVVPQFVHSGLLIARSPPGSPGTVVLRVRDEGDLSALSSSFTFDTTASFACPVLGHLDPDTGSSTGGYSILAYGGALTPTTEVEFGVGSGNFSRDIFFVSDLLLRVEVPEALPEQIGATLPVGATDPPQCPEALKTVDFTYTAAQEAAPRILYVDTTVEVPITPTAFPALRVGGGDRMLVVGSGFDQRTTFDLTKPQGSATTSAALFVTVLTPNLAVMTAPASPDGLPGLADLQAHNAFGDSEDFPVEYVQPGPPSILDVRNLDDGTQTAPIDGGDRILIFGDNFFAPLTIRLTGCDLAAPASTITREFTLASPGVTLLEDHILGVDVPPNTFCEGALGIEVLTDFGSATFDDEDGPIFMLIGPQPPIVAGVFPQKFNSGGGQEAVFFGRHFTSTTAFSVKTTPMASFVAVLSPRIVSDTVAIVFMPELVGGMPPAGVAGSVRAEETDAVLRSKIAGDPFTVQSDLFRVCTDFAPILRGVVPNMGSIDGSEQVLLFGEDFLTALGESNVSALRLVDVATSTDVGTYTEATPAALPLGSADAGKFVVLNNHTILLITNPRARITPEGAGAPVTVIVESGAGNTMLAGAFTYKNTPAVRTPFLLGITPNETRLSGGTSHLLSGGFLSEADRIVLTRPSDATTLVLPVDTGAPPTAPGSFAQVTDNFLVFVMPDLTGTFAAGDKLTVRAEKDLNGTTLISNSLPLSLRVSFAGPPTITPELSPEIGGAFGSDVITIEGSLFTPNSQVLFGTIPAKHVVFVDSMTLIAIVPPLPLDVPDPGLDLKNVHLASEGARTVDVAVFTPGGWAVLEDAFTYEPEDPTVVSCAPGSLAEGATARIHVFGTNFVPGLTTATPDAGTAGPVTVHSFNDLSFDYTAPTFPPGTLGPESAEVTIATNQGTAAAPCVLEIILAPFFTGCTTTYAPNDEASPTTGIHAGAFVIATVEGGNFLPGGALEVRTRVAENPKLLQEIGALAPFTKQGQFKVIDPETIAFSVPNVFSSQVPTLLDGNPNVGPAALTYKSPAGPAATEEACFHYVPFLLDFDDFRFEVPPFYPGLSAPGKLKTGDINADGVLDIAVLAQQTVVGTPGVTGIEPEAFLYYADTFGPIDFNGDGVAPDFAGTFTVAQVGDDDFHTFVPSYARGQDILLANLDDDDELEVIIPVQALDGGGDPVMIADIEPGGTVGAITILTPSIMMAYNAGIAVGRFDDTTSHPDIAILLGHADPAMRKLVVFRSTGAFTYSELVVDIPAAHESWTPGALAAGDFDGDGDDDFIWGQHQGGPSGTSFEHAPFLVAAVDSTAGTVGTPTALTNLTGSIVFDIEVFDSDGDGKVDAHILVRNRVAGALVAPASRLGGGIATAFDPVSTLTADVYTETPFRISRTSRDGNGIGLTHGDVNADGIQDLAVVNDDGEILVYLGNGDGTFRSSGRSWQILTTTGTFHQAVQSITAGDFNADGLAELIAGDMTGPPFNLVFWLNISR